MFFLAGPVTVFSLFSFIVPSLIRLIPVYLFKMLYPPFSLSFLCFMVGELEIYWLGLNLELIEGDAISLLLVT